jgi:hypothetical protein
MLGEQLDPAYIERWVHELGLGDESKRAEATDA